jgi:hypothetical protein
MARGQRDHQKIVAEGHEEKRGVEHSHDEQADAPETVQNPGYMEEKYFQAGFPDR